MTSSEDKLNQLINDCQLEIAPKRDLWPQIAAAIEESPQSEIHLVDSPTPKAVNKNQQEYTFLAIACGLVFAFLASLLIDTQQTPSQQSDFIAAELKLPNNEGKQALLDSIESINIQHQLAIEQFTSIGKMASWPLSADSPNQNGLEQLKQAAELIYQALIANPYDPKLWQLWLWTHRQEIDLLRLNQKYQFMAPKQGVSL